MRARRIERTRLKLLPTSRDRDELTNEYVMRIDSTVKTAVVDEHKGSTT